MAHWEMIGTMIYQCMRGASLEEIEAAGLIGYYTIHGRGVYPADPNGVPFMASYIQCTGDPIADLVEDLAADAAIIQEQHGRKRGTSLLHIKKGAEKLLFTACAAAHYFCICNSRASSISCFLEETSNLL